MEKRSLRALLNVACFLVFVVIIFAAVYTSVPRASFWQTQQLKVRSSPHAQTSMALQDVYAYVSDQLLVLLYDPFSELPSENMTAYTADGLSVTLAVRLRQIRVKSASCAVPDLMRNVVAFCEGELGVWSTESKHYAPGWKPLNKSLNGSDDIGAFAASYKYSGTNDAFLLSAASLIGAYPSGTGYIANLGGNWSQAQLNLAALNSNGWIDSRTRLLYMDFLVYNVQSRLFTISLSRFEAVSSEFRFSGNLFSIDLDPYSTAMGSMAAFFQLLACVAIVIFAILIVNDACKTKKLKRENKWFWFDIFLLLLGFVTVAIFACFNYSCNLALNQVKQFDDHNAMFGYLQFTGILRNVNYSLSGLYICCITFRLLKLLMMGSRFAFLGQTLASFFSAACTLFFVFVCLVMAFDLAFYLLLFSQAAYSSVPKSLVATFGLTFAEDNQWYLFNNTNSSVLAPALYVCFVFVIVLVFMRLVICLLVQTVRETRQKFTADLMDSFVLSHWLWKLLDTLACAKPNASEDSRFVYIAERIDVEELLTNFKTVSNSFTKQVYNLETPVRPNSAPQSEEQS